MDYNEFEKQLARYKAYSFGEISEKCELVVEKETIAGFDFSPYDLNNSFFVDVEFDSCDFSGVYLSGSFFGGSSFRSCMLEDNTLRKANWNGANFQQTTIKRLDAFRTTFMRNTFRECVFQDCKIGAKCLFAWSHFKDVFFDSCTFERTFLDDAHFTNVRFRNCQFNDVDLPEDFDVEKASGSVEYCYTSPEQPPKTERAGI